MLISCVQLENKRFYARFKAKFKGYPGLWKVTICLTRQAVKLKLRTCDFQEHMFLERLLAMKII